MALIGEAMSQRIGLQVQGVGRLTLTRKKNTLSSENGRNEERIDSEVDNCVDAGGAGS